MGKYKGLSPIERFKRIPQIMDKLENWYLENPSQHRWKYYSLINFLAYTGVRVSEALNLKWKDIDIEKGECIITQLKKKKKTQRIIPLHRKLIRIFKKKYKKISDKEQKVWNITRQSIWEFLNRRFGINPHMFRHYFGTQVLKHADMETARRVLGHTNYEILKIYLHLDLRDLRKTIEQIDMFK